MNFLEVAKRTPRYGVDIHYAKVIKPSGESSFLSFSWLCLLSFLEDIFWNLLLIFAKIFFHIVRYIYTFQTSLFQKNYCSLRQCGIIVE